MITACNIMKILEHFFYLCFHVSKGYRQQNKIPNIILLVADDLGYSDIGCYGGEIKIPALNKLATEDVRLKEIQISSSVC